MDMEEILSAGLAELGLDGRVPPDSAPRLAAYGRLLLEKNRVMNLTAIREEAGVARLHMLDCAALLTLPGLDFAGKTLIDVGAGAGFPGLPLKLLVPSLEVTLLDSLGKRVDWLNEVSARLRLSGVQAIHARAEEQALLPGFRDAFDLAAARAVAELRLLAELCLPFLRVGGLFLAMKSTGSGEELREAAGAIRFLGGRLRDTVDYTVPGAGTVHRVIVIEKTGPTPAGYPRRWARIQKAPLSGAC